MMMIDVVDDEEEEKDDDDDDNVLCYIDVSYDDIVGNVMLCLILILSH